MEGINEFVKIKLSELIVSEWTLLSIKDLMSEIETGNEFEEYKITDYDKLVWSAPGISGLRFTVIDCSIDSRVDSAKLSFALPTETEGILLVHKSGKIILKSFWHGYEFILHDRLDVSLEGYPVTEHSFKLIIKILEALSLDSD